MIAEATKDTFRKLAELVEKASISSEVSNCGDGCCPSYATTIDADALVRILKEAGE